MRRVGHRHGAVANRLAPGRSHELRRDHPGRAGGKQQQHGGGRRPGEPQTADRVGQVASAIAQMLAGAACSELRWKRGTLRAQAVVRRGEEA